MVTSVPTATLKFDTDFDFDFSNAQFMKEEKEMEGQDRMTVKGWFISSSDPCTNAVASKPSPCWASPALLVFQLSVPYTQVFARLLN